MSDIWNKNDYLYQLEKSNDFDTCDKVPVPNLTKDFFVVSYSRKDYKQVYQDLAELKDAGFPFWYDSENHSGESWFDNFCNNFDNDACKGVILFLSENFFSSQAVIRELKYISTDNQNFNKNVILVNLTNENEVSDIYLEKDVCELWKTSFDNNKSKGAAFFSTLFDDDKLYLKFNAANHIDELCRDIKSRFNLTPDKAHNNPAFPNSYVEHLSKFNKQKQIVENYKSSINNLNNTLEQDYQIKSENKKILNDCSILRSLFKQCIGMEIESALYKKGFIKEISTDGADFYLKVDYKLSNFKRTYKLRNIIKNAELSYDDEVNLLLTKILEIPANSFDKEKIILESIEKNNCKIEILSKNYDYISKRPQTKITDCQFDLISCDNDYNYEIEYPYYVNCICLSFAMKTNVDLMSEYSENVNYGYRKMLVDTEKHYFWEEPNQFYVEWIMPINSQNKSGVCYSKFNLLIDREHYDDLRKNKTCFTLVTSCSDNFIEELNHYECTLYFENDIPKMSIDLLYLPQYRFYKNYNDGFEAIVSDDVPF